MDMIKRPLYYCCPGATKKQRESFHDLVACSLADGYQLDHVGVLEDGTFIVAMVR